MSPPSQTPTLFQPIKIRSCTLKNRIIVAPMCQYSAPSSLNATKEQPEGSLTPYHLATLGHYALKGAALVFVEASGVSPNGRISPNCPGMWSDDQIPALRKICEFIHAQGGKVGMQLAHAGRKGSTAPPNVAAAQKPPMLSLRADKEHGGWPDNVPGPTGGMAWSEKDGGRQYWPPKELSFGEIRELVENFAQAARRSVEAGVDVIEIHSAHGYLLHQFLSPITNRRTDGYGGSFEGRTRFLIEVINAIRSVIPSSMPLFLRISATEWMEGSAIAKERGSWDEEQAKKLAKLLPALGVDLLDVSSGGNCEDQRIQPHSGYQVEIAGRIRKMMKDEGLKLLIGAVGLITEAEQARDIVEGSIEEEARVAKDMLDAKGGKEPLADVVLIARQFMRDPAFVLRVAAELDVKVAWPGQFRRVRFNTKKENKI